MMESYLQQVIQCAISKALLDKVTFVEDIQFMADIDITVDKTDTACFVISERMLKENSHIYQRQFSLLFGEKNEAVNIEEKQLPTTEDQLSLSNGIIPSDQGESTLRQRTAPSDQGESTHRESTVPSDQGESTQRQGTVPSDQGESTPREGMEMENTADEILESVLTESQSNEVERQDRHGVMVTDTETQTENFTSVQLKRKPRKSANQQKKTKSVTDSPKESTSQMNQEPEVMDIKTEVISDDDHTETAGSVTIVSPLPPSDLQTNTINNVTCPLCPTQFRSQKAVENHLKVTHDIGNIYRCQVSTCQELCQSNTALHQHMMMIHGGPEGEEAQSESPPKKKRGRKPKNLNKEMSVPLKEKEVSVAGDEIADTPLVKPKARPKTAKKQKGRKPGRKKGGLKLTLKTSAAAVDDKGTQKCAECPKEYASKRALNRHIKTAHDVMKYNCDICDKVFSSKETMYHHRRGIHSDSKPYKCQQCDASFSFNHSLRLHILKHSGARPFECKECNKTYLTSNHLKMHVEGVHGGKKNHTCKICGKCFSYTTSLKVHEMTHGEYRPYRCNTCGQGFVNSHSLKYHKESKHSQNTWFECDLCGKKYKTEFLMKTHRRRHTADGSRFMCDICGRQFMYKSTLEIHAAVHSDAKSFQCSTCGKSFKTYATLYSHQYVHKSESPYNCPECGKSFKTKERCKAHQKRHSGLKPFECKECGRCFPDKGGLSKHTKTVHCEVKMFVCDICGKSCSRADNLRVHMKIHNKQVDGNISGRKLHQTSKQGKPLTVMETPEDLEQKDQQGQEYLNISPNSSPPHTMTIPRIYPDRPDAPPFIPNATDPLPIPSGGHGILLTTQESELGSIANSSIHPSNPLLTVPNTTSQAPPGSSYMYMWPYIHTQHQQDQAGPSNQFF
ncbi:zinc finger protein 665-like [Saccostrea echinata]|uniref:zinc finger protein 665-like n=1 Tax=Saccostrea echinata TaxID=191078 RepID=UPI002A80817E|nr:zinc finger protein 665-like [Saccostrea echinata]